MYEWVILFAGILSVEGFGYAYHRWFEHGEVLRYVRENRILREVVRRHWTHHAKNYPPENLRPDTPYRTEDVLGWYLLAAAATAFGLAILPWSLGAPLAAGGWGYGLFVDFLHSRFHLRDHLLSRNRAFLYLQRVHDIHHIDQTKNFTIVVPLMDILFGTYLGHLPGTGVRPAGPGPAAA